MPPCQHVLDLQASKTKVQHFLDFEMGTIIPKYLKRDRLLASKHRYQSDVAFTLVWYLAAVSDYILGKQKRSLPEGASLHAGCCILF